MPITIYTTPSCPYSKLAVELLKERKVKFIEKDARNEDIAEEMYEVSKQMGVPVIVFENREFIVGWNKEQINEAIDKSIAVKIVE